MPPAAPPISLEAITVRFGPTLALDDVSLTLTPGRCHALVGENGAGKSTLLNVLFGMVTPTAGHIVVGGAQRRLGSPADAIACGIGRVPQHVDLIDAFTVAENVVLGREPRRGLCFDRDAARSQVAELSRRHGLAIDPDTRVGALSVAARQRVEILKALHRRARVLLLDEPTAALTPAEADGLWNILKTMAAEGATVVVVTHKIDDVLAHADEVTALRRGRRRYFGPVAQTTASALAAALVGDDNAPPARRAPRPAAPPERPALRLERLCVHGPQGEPALVDATLDLFPGEIVGLAGVDGSGQTTLIEAILGLRPIVSGTLMQGETDLTRLSIAARRAAGIGYIPDDRQARALALPLPVTRNILLGRQREKAFTRPGGLLRPAAIRAFADAQCAAFAIRGAERDPPVRALSGGNQQKLVLARELSRKPAILLAAQPTRGLDFAATAFVHDTLRAACDRGAAILCTSLDLEELRALSDRIAVFLRGRIVAVLAREDATEERLGALVTGASP